ncbi:hypothetical protein V2S66_07480 [Streptomyces sp. V4-01]|uniref:Uncharacterized protein n=1 Tax=Actinacidiphila polyblastidii TaxID=3110430 RepID=A0ABU7P7P2_9ACTN|nr:hypothetical protein [Streptomyces sp. V4-01]
MAAQDPQDPQDPHHDPVPAPPTATTAPSVRDLLAAGAAARTVSTPPGDEPRQAPERRDAA